MGTADDIVVEESGAAKIPETEHEIVRKKLASLEKELQRLSGETGPAREAADITSKAAR